MLPSKIYIDDVVDSDTPKQDVTVLKTREYEMLDPHDRSAFMDVLGVLFRKFGQGDVRMGLAWAEFRGNPVMNVTPSNIHED